MQGRPAGPGIQAYSGGAARQEAAIGGVGACPRNKVHTEQNLNRIVWARCRDLCVLLLRMPICVGEWRA